MNILTLALLVLALGAAGWGFFTLTPATLGAGLVGLACLFAIMGRISQAADHQSQRAREPREP